MAAHNNRPGMPPRFPAKDGYDFDGTPLTDPTPPSRGPLLRGEAWSLLMPGQSLGEPPENPPFEKPAVWPAAGTPLRVPKTVFLTSCPPPHLYGENFTLCSKWVDWSLGYLGHHTDSRARDAITGDPSLKQEVPYGSEVFDAFSGYYEYIGWSIDPQYDRKLYEVRRGFMHYTVVPNPIKVEHERLIREFRAAKARLEAKYPNQVFVQICEFFPADPVLGVAPHDTLRPRVLDVYTPAGVAANTPKHVAIGPAWMLGPNSVRTVNRLPHLDFFGTDFLHIYCGYQAGLGTGLNRDRRSNIDFLRWAANFVGNTGYPLDPQFGWRHDWFQAAIDPDDVTDGVISDGYEGTAYQRYIDYALSTMGDVVDVPFNPRTGVTAHAQPSGKFGLLKAGFPCFAGYHVALHEYDLAFDFGRPVKKMKDGSGVTSEYPRGDLNYYDQDWVEMTIILQYALREEIQRDDIDAYFPGPEGLRGDGSYNQFIRYPRTEQYTLGWDPLIAKAYADFKQICTNLGPKTVAIWEELIARKSLGDYGFAYEGASTYVDADSIVAYVEAHYGLSAGA